MNHHLPEDTKSMIDDALLREKLMDALTPGLMIEFDPDEACQAGAFVEDALSEADAIDSGLDAEEELA